MAKHFLSLLDFTPDDLHRSLELASSLGADRRARRISPHGSALAGRQVGLLFEKPSLRTRVTFTIGIGELGGSFVDIPSDVMHADREPLHDVSRNLERWVDAVVIRTFAQARLSIFTDSAPQLRIVNALSDEEHPCQALADMLTLRERWGAIAGRTLAFVGDGNTVATSFVHAGLMLGAHVRVATPKAYALPAEVGAAAERIAVGGAELTQYVDPKEAVAGADAVYTDVWTSMGQEVEYAERNKIFSPYQVNGALMARAKAGAIFMHCLPAHRGQEVTDEVIESAASVVFDQAENRLHAQKAMLVTLFS
ncbi:MAG TPA: ornithine carbamoyltransferase [Vicinamibacterales bacterium]|nr:ornithine carbamoyltransferase [Vicinamibacterales bacterium]